MKLASNWKRIITGAWSVRLMVVGAIMSSLPVFIALVNADILGISPLAFAIGAAMINVLAILARILTQPGSTFLSDESGAVGRKMVGGATALAVAIAIATPVISDFEGRELQAYRDIVGVWTICDGETSGVQPGDVATDAECDEKLAVRVRQFAVEIARCLPENTPVKARAAFISASYNIGSAGFCKSSMSRRALAGDFRGACEALSMWDKGRINGVLQRIRGLTRRRAAERALCLSALEAG